MPLSLGEKLGPYEILEPIGKGGMGEVYRARDTRLDRDVAIKVLPAAVAKDPERLARFKREAKALAALNHPNIAAIYGLEDRGRDDRAIVMELVEGPTLAERLHAGPLDVHEALRIALAVADALEAAHDRGVVHRDLKPANVKAPIEGTVKVLDLGLATALPGSERSSADPVNSPTLTMGATEAGVILGTAAYMSPEQASGRRVDRRADIWSYGVVLWEMLTGKRLFDGGETVSHTLADVLRSEIDFSKLPASTPPPIRQLLRRCLDRDVKTRLRDIGEARVAIHTVGQVSDLPVGAQAKGHSKLAWVVAGALLLTTLALGYVAYRHTMEEPPPLVNLSLLPPDKGNFAGTSIPAISPDGRRVAFGSTVDGKTAIWVRDLDALAARVLPGTEDGQYPFWSPDGRTVAFFAGNKLKRIDVAGGPPVTVCDLIGSLGRGGAWGKDVIVFAVNTAGAGFLFQVPAAGGTAEILFKPDAASGSTLLRWPTFLPDGRHFLYSANNSDLEKSAILVADRVSRTYQRLILGASNAVYSAGNLLYVRDQTLVAQPFDSDKLQTLGSAVPIAEHIERGINSLQYQFSASRNGVLVFKAGSAAGDVQLTWFDRSGKPLGMATPASFFVSNWGAISPDGSMIVMDGLDPRISFSSIWLRDLIRGTDSRFTFGRFEINPIWSPDGNHIAFTSSTGGTVPHVLQKDRNGSQDQLLTQPLDDPPRPTYPRDWSRDGQYIIEEVQGGATAQDLWVQPLFGDKKPFPYLKSPFAETQGKLSSDGKWLAYASNETNRFEIYVQTFPTPGSKAQVSTEGGSKPVWSRDGKELYFIGADRKMMAVDVKTGAKFQAGTPKALFDTRIGGSGSNLFDVGKDGRFLIPVQREQSEASPLTVVLNWPALMKK